MKVPGKFVVVVDVRLVLCCAIIPFTFSKLKKQKQKKAPKNSVC